MDHQTPDTAPIMIEVTPLPGEVAVVRLAGVLDRKTAPLAREQIVATVAQGHKKVILDLSGVPHVDGPGVQSLAYSLHRLRQAGGDLRIAAPTPPVKQRIAVARLDDVLPVHPTIEDALADVS